VGRNEGGRVMFDQRNPEFGSDQATSDCRDPRVAPDPLAGDHMIDDDQRCVVPGDPLGPARNGNDGQAGAGGPDPLPAGTSKRASARRTTFPPSRPARTPEILDGKPKRAARARAVVEGRIGSDHQCSDDRCPRVAPDPLAGDHIRGDGQRWPVPGDPTPAGTRHEPNPEPQSSPPAPPGVVAAVRRLRRLHSELQFAQAVRIAVTNRFSAFIRLRVLGVSTFDGKDALTKAVRETARIRKALAKGLPLGIEGVEEADEAALRMLDAGVAQAAGPFDTFETGHRKQMERLAATLPGADFVRSVRGFGMYGFAMLVGEAGDIGSYATHQRLWKRMGLAVVEGERQQRKSNPALAAAHGYNPKRRAISWAVAESLFRGQSTDPPGPYRVIYDDAKAAYLKRGETDPAWTKGRAHNAAKRKMEKFLLMRLHQAWRRDLAAGDEILGDRAYCEDHESSVAEGAFGSDPDRRDDQNGSVAPDPLAGDQRTRADQASGVPGESYARDRMGLDHHYANVAG
jgi:hypothetical protein